ncbi:MAG: tetratricopeptide repeat protein, partial [Pyrinomonadaceae bacterium]
MFHPQSSVSPVAPQSQPSKSRRVAFVVPALIFLCAASVLGQSDPFGAARRPPATTTTPQPKQQQQQAVSAETTRAQPTTAETSDPVKPAPTATTPPAAESEPTPAELRLKIKDAKPGRERAALQKQLVDRLVQSGQKDEALAELRLLIHEDRFDPPFFFNTGNALARLGDAGAAADAYRKAISQRRGGYARALNNLGVILMRQGRWDEAHDALTGALAQEGNNYAEASYNLGRLHFLRGENGPAIREWKRTLKLEPDHADAAAALARAYAADGEPREGLKVIEAFVARGTRLGSSGVPQNIAYARREIVEASSIDSEEATPVVATATAAPSRPGVVSSPRRPSSPSGRRAVYALDQPTYKLLESARDAREAGRYEAAVKHYRDVIARSPGRYFAPANLELGFALMNLKRPAEAADALRTVTEKDDARYPIAHLHL